MCKPCFPSGCNVSTIARRKYRSHALCRGTARPTSPPASSRPACCARRTGAAGRPRCRSSLRFTAPSYGLNRYYAGRDCSMICTPSSIDAHLQYTGAQLHAVGQIRLQSGCIAAHGAHSLVPAHAAQSLRACRQCSNFACLCHLLHASLRLVSPHTTSSPAGQFLLIESSGAITQACTIGTSRPPSSSRLAASPLRLSSTTTPRRSCCATRAPPSPSITTKRSRTCKTAWVSVQMDLSTF